MRPSTTFALAFAVAVAAAPGAARAQATASSTIAESLFRDAQSRLAAGDIPAACDLFAKSQRVEAALGTLLNLASCHERDGKTATAWTEFQNAIAWAVRSADHAREQYARAQVASLDKRLHRVVIDVIDPASLTQVELDGAPLPREALGTAIPLDPGEHTIDATGAGKTAWVRKIHLGPAAGTDRIEVRFEPLGAAPLVAPPPSDAWAAGAQSPAPGPPAELPASPAPVEVTASPSGRTSARRTAGFVVGGAGIVGVGVAVAFGVAMAESASRRDSACPPGLPCANQSAFDDDRAARLDQQGMFIAGGAGIVALAVGTYLFVTSRHAASQATTRDLHVGLSAAPDGRGLRLSGNW
ncbi:MAG TPA: hypothetical protein VGM06_05820 [Polyangiaceae bacterium]